MTTGPQNSQDRPATLTRSALHLAAGILMGAADIIPGVSGGTVALVVGIYSRLVTAISRVNRELIVLVMTFQWRQAAAYLDLRFLVALGAGIAIGAVVLGSRIEQLLTVPTTRAVTLSAFLGMIIASTLIVISLIHPRSGLQRLACLGLGLAAAGFAFWLTGLGQLSTASHPLYIFLCGAIGICAMILPGISGAYLLIILGFYPQLTDILHRLKEGDLHVADMIVLAAFGAGCFVGIIAFSKLLRWLLNHRLPLTMSVLAGFMIGALRKVWPFQRDLTPGEIKLKNKLFEPYLPAAWDDTVMWCVVTGAVAMILVICVDRMARKDRTQL